MKSNATHLSEDQLASLAIALIQTQDTSEADDDHLRDCRLCTKKLAFFTKFYENLSDEMKHRYYEPMALELQASGNETVIPFSRFQANPLSQQEPFGNAGLILAAKEMSHSSDRYTTLATFSSANPSAVLRVLEDRQEHRCRIFILSDVSDIRNQVRVTLTDDDGRTIAVLTDEEGVAIFPVPNEFNWARSYVAVSARLANTPPTRRT